MSIHRTAVVAATVLFAAIATAADRGKTPDADGRDPSVREAQAAQQEARRGRLRDEDPAQLERNRFARCEVLSAEEREYCIRRMNGEGTVSGSVEGGGIYRELRVKLPVQ